MLTGNNPAFNKKWFGMFNDFRARPTILLWRYVASKWEMDCIIVLCTIAGPSPRASRFSQTDGDYFITFQSKCQISPNKSCAKLQDWTIPKSSLKLPIVEFKCLLHRFPPLFLEDPQRYTFQMSAYPNTPDSTQIREPSETCTVRGPQATGSGTTVLDQRALVLDGEIR